MPHDVDQHGTAWHTQRCTTQHSMDPVFTDVAWCITICFGFPYCLTGLQTYIATCKSSRSLRGEPRIAPHAPSPGWKAFSLLLLLLLGFINTTGVRICCYTFPQATACKLCCRCFFLHRPRVAMFERIDLRVEEMVEQGLLKVTCFLACVCSPSTSSQCQHSSNPLNIVHVMWAAH